MPILWGKMVMSFPAHFPYEDGWRFCPQCQRFYNIIEGNLCPIHKSVLRWSRPKRFKNINGKIINNQNRRKVWNNGMGLPTWTLLKEFMASPKGKESVKRFVIIQESIKDKILLAPENKRITYGELGAKDFQAHWFIKEYRK